MFEKKDDLNLPLSLLRMDNISEDFTCILSDQTPIQGHLYLNDHCIGFISDNKEKTFSLNFNETKNIILNEENIEFETKDENKIKFFSFNDFNSVFNKINSNFKLYTETEIKDEKNSASYSDSGDFNNDTEETNKRSPSPKISVSSSNSICSLNEENEPKSRNKNNNNIKKIILDEEKSDIKIPRNDSSDAFENTIKTNSDQSENPENPSIIPEKIVFKKLIPDLDYEICTKIINLPPKEFFEKYQTNKNPETSYSSYYKWVGEYSEINVEDWEKIKQKEKSNFEKFQRKEKFCLALHGVPLINKSNVEKTCTYWIDNDGTYYMNTLSKSTGVPLSDKFTVETGAEFHPFMNNTKTVFRTYVRTNVIKWTMFKSALISQGKKSYNKEVEDWLKFITEKGDKVVGDYCCI